MQSASDARFCDGCGQPNRLAARFCASCGADLPECAIDALAPLGLALRLFDRGEVLKARTLLETAVADHPNDHRVRLVYATLLLQAGDLEIGLEHLQLVRANAPWSPVVEAYIGGALLGLNRVSEAKDTLDDAVQQAPDDFYVLLKRGELYCRLGIYLTAVEALERASRVRVDDPVAREAAWRLLRFARDKSAGGFVRQMRARTTGFAFKWPWRAAERRAPIARADEVWGT
jgi:predicted Zn-dependent protease